MDAASHSVAVVAQIVLPERVGVIVLDRNSEVSLSRARRLLRAADATDRAPALGVACCPHGLTVLCAANEMRRAATFLGDEQVLSADVCPTDQVLRSLVLRDALQQWLIYQLTAHEGFMPVSDGLLVDMRHAEPDGARGALLHTACALKPSLSLGAHGRTGDGRISVEMRLSLHIEGRCWKGCDGVARLLGGDGALAAELRACGSVDLTSDRWWRTYADPDRLGDRTNEISLLPSHTPATILALSHDPPTHWPNSCGAVGPPHCKTAEEHAAEWGETLGLWVDPSCLSPFATVRMDLDAPADEFCDDGRSCPWRIVPAAAVWPSAGMRVVRRASQVPAEEALARLLTWLSAQTPLDVGTVKLMGAAVPLPSRAPGGPAGAGPGTGAPGFSPGFTSAATLASRGGGDSFASAGYTAMEGGTGDPAATAAAALKHSLQLEPIRSRSGGPPRGGAPDAARAPPPPSAGHKRKGPPLFGLSDVIGGVTLSQSRPMAARVVYAPLADVPGPLPSSRPRLGASPSAPASKPSSAAAASASSAPRSAFDAQPARPFGGTSTGAKAAATKASEPAKPKAAKAAGQSASGPKSAVAAPDGVALVTDPAALGALKVPGLKQQCVLRGLKVSGTRAQLLERLGCGPAPAESSTGPPGGAAVEAVLPTVTAPPSKALPSLGPRKLAQTPAVPTGSTESGAGPPGGATVVAVLPTVAAPPSKAPPSFGPQRLAQTPAAPTESVVRGAAEGGAGGATTQSRAPLALASPSKPPPTPAAYSYISPEPKPPRADTPAAVRKQRVTFAPAVKVFDGSSRPAGSAPWLPNSATVSGQQEALPQPQPSHEESPALVPSPTLQTASGSWLAGPAWPGDAQSDWIRPMGRAAAEPSTLTPAAAAMVGAAFRHLDGDGDGGLSPKELSAFNVATGSDELEEDDLAYLTSTFEMHAPSGGLTYGGFAAYHVDALVETLAETIGDLRKLNLAHRRLSETELKTHGAVIRAAVVGPTGGGGQVVTQGVRLTPEGVQAVLRIVRVLQDGAGTAPAHSEAGLGEAELQLYQQATGSDALPADDLQWLWDTFHRLPATSAIAPRLSDRGFTDLIM